MVTSVFLHYPNAGYLQNIRTILGRLLGDVWEIEADSEMVSNLVPAPLRLGAESWLILHQSNNDRELLILPFPDRNDLELLSNLELLTNTAEGFREELSELIQILVYGDFHRFSEGPRSSEWFRRFQYLHSDVSLYSILDLDSRQQRLNIILCQETSQNIQHGRENALRRAQSEGNFSGLAVQLENVFLKAINKLFINIENQGFKEVVPPIVDRFWNVMDGETMRFLVTSETVRVFADKYSPTNFDYSAPGCGLWKAVERELNLSLVLHLRRKLGIIENVNCPWKGSQGISGRVPILTGNKKNHNQDLNQRETEDQTENLKGIMLGPMKFICEWGHYNSVREKLEDISSLNDAVLDYLLGQRLLGKRSRSRTDTLPKHLDQIRKLRNRYAHISAMSQKQFEKLHHLVLPSAHKPETCLVKILEFKREVLEYWEAEGDCFTTNQMFVTTENHRSIDFSCYNRMNVRYNKNKSTAELVATCGDGDDPCIATFDKIEEANAALAALAKAAAAGEKSWNVLDFKKTLAERRE